MKVLICGLSGSGKTTLAKEVIKHLPCVYLNADKVREISGDYDFSIKGRINQAQRMKALAATAKDALVIADFICPTEETRNIFNADLCIWMNTVKECRYPDTNQIFERPQKVGIEITTKDAATHSLMVIEKIRSMMEKVSLVIPVHNAESTLRECLNSALDQSHSNFELIVVDNASTDKSKEIIFEFLKKDHRIRYVFEPFRSRGAARNKGIETARASIIAMTDADCIVPRHWLETLIDPILKKNEYIVVGNEDDLVGNYWTRMQQRANQDFLVRHLHRAYIDHLDTKNFAIQRMCFGLVGLFDRNIANFEDFEFKLRLKKAGYHMYFLKDLKVKHRHSCNFVQLFLKRIDQGFWASKIYWMHKDFLKRNPEEMLKSMNLMNFFTFFPWLMFSSFKNNLNKTIYELITGVAWRIGVVWARVQHL